MAGLFVRVLGEVSLSRDGERVPLPPKPQLLLALLVAPGDDGVGNDELLDVLYDGAPPATAEAAVRVHVAKLRDALEPDGPAPPRAASRSCTTRGGSGWTDGESDVGLFEAGCVRPAP